MYQLKGFIEIDALSNNTPGNTATLGELSNISSTYSIEKSRYHNAANSNVTLVAFASRYDNDARIEVPVSYANHVLNVTQWLYTQSVAGVFTNDAEAMENAILAQFGSIIDKLLIGKPVVYKGCWLPSWISWEFKTAGEDNTIRLWFADEIFKAQYDEYQIVVIPPVTPVDTFQKVKLEVEAALADFNIPDYIATIPTYTGGEPYTFLITNEYAWYDREDSAATLKATWSVVIYGKAGNSLELIKQALQNYILANSAYIRNDWAAVFPDIFDSTEFIIVPGWNSISVENETAAGSLYSPILSYDKLISFVSKFTDYEPEAFIAANLQTGTVAYKSLSMMTIGSPANRDNKFKLTDFYKDYSALSTLSMDFNLMSDKTIAFVLLLTEAIIAAEGLDEYSYIGVNLSRVTRNGITYIGFSHLNNLYLVVSRTSLLANIG